MLALHKYLTAMGLAGAALLAAAFIFSDGLWVRQGGGGNCAAAWSPCAFAEGVRKARPGDTVHVMGTIRTPVVIDVSGKEGAPVTFTGGTVDTLGSVEQSAVLVTGDWIVIDRMEIVHGYDFGIRVNGDHVTIRASRIHDNVMNPLYRLKDGKCNSAQRSGWGSGHRHYIGADDGLVIGNEVYNNCGEGITALQANSLQIIGNTVHDNFSVGIYIDSSQQVYVRNNTTRAANPAYFRNGKPMRGVSLGQEAYDWAPFVQIRDIVIDGNLFDRVGGIAFYYEISGAHLENVTVVNNTFLGVPEPQIDFPNLAGNKGIVITNNAANAGN
ncbi:MAG: right-handed parallel beta-helix repeat-containing protein [Anaerolineae bacterium CFX3]|jgi:parallel beta-helix repeat protein|nr:hypothetical protein [Anaerolineales bacterium]MCC7511037.1 right-handed parallel beta-helix repeat-containing protein [Anaerolineae bacterium]MCE7905802.1 right-handed parallel beta-helix repeat-containing protein [Anaerolineae bacterium CFX3]OQY85282.1 MAG: hypothetical protein B6D40_03860 [Anaerolineae bacterium UTCFX3]MBW7917747.1 right-handed parallel beta-helix repeat-containing protein [Anaerolineales bacterium]